MPKKKSKATSSSSSSSSSSAPRKASASDDDLDSMLAEFRAADLTSDAASSTTTSTTKTSTSSAKGTMRVSEDAIIKACIAGNVNQLRRWGKQGIRVASAWPLIQLALKAAPPDVLRCLIKDLGADVNGAREDGYTPLLAASFAGQWHVVRCLVKEFGGDVNRPGKNGVTILMIASAEKNAEMVKWLVKAGADPQALSTGDAPLTAAGVSQEINASAEQTAYLEAKSHCSSPGCGGAGLKKCPACKRARYCGEPCQLAHWKAHKADCRRWSAELKAAEGTKGK